MRRHISLPDLLQARSEVEDRERQCRLYQLYQHCPSPSTISIPDLARLEDQLLHLQHLHHLPPGLAGQNGLVVNSASQPCPPQKERKGIFLKKGKKSAALSRDLYNKYEKRKSVKRFFTRNHMNICAPQMNLLSLSRLSKSETSLLKPADMFMWR